MNRNQRIAKATETVGIIEAGQYTVNGHDVNIETMLQESLDRSQHYREQDLDAVLDAVALAATPVRYATEIRVENCTVIAGAADLVHRGGRVGCLNFASAKNPGGGFLNGAQAQEESLAMSSSLYATQMAHFRLYEYNRGRNTYLYSHQMIYSPDVVIFRDEAGELLDTPYQIDMLTSPAVNVGAMRNNWPEELKHVEPTMLARMDMVLALFLHHGVSRLLLGAWGCGVFQNDPAQMAGWFAHYLMPGGKYADCFEEVLFAVFDRSNDGQNIGPFQQVFGTLPPDHGSDA